jgi:hypothetical protein
MDDVHRVILVSLLFVILGVHAEGEKAENGNQQARHKSLFHTFYI